jgi:hypothetical protein
VYTKAINNLLEKNLTKRAFALWKQLNGLFPNIWDYPTSSTGKYHQKKGGRVPSCAEHVYEMLYAANKILRMFGVKKRTSDGDVILLAVVWHDAFKYGENGTHKHTNPAHDKLMGDVIAENESTLKEIFSDDQVKTLELMIRFHSGMWSSDNSDKTSIDFSKFPPYVLFIHSLDMLSTADCLKTDMED